MLYEVITIQIKIVRPWYEVLRADFREMKYHRRMAKGNHPGAKVAADKLRTLEDKYGEEFDYERNNFV